MSLTQAIPRMYLGALSPITSSSKEAIKLSVNMLAFFGGGPPSPSIIEAWSKALRTKGLQASPEALSMPPDFSRNPIMESMD